jgi:hypothetical protein
MSTDMTDEETDIAVKALALKVIEFIAAQPGFNAAVAHIALATVLGAGIKTGGPSDKVEKRAEIMFSIIREICAINPTRH